MNQLENKIPPPIVMAIFGLLIWLCRDFGPILPLENGLRYFLCGAFVAAALTLDISAFLEFKKFKTTINPLKPENASNIVQSGAFGKTRNPMYLGMVILLIGWSFFNGALVGYVLVFLFWAFINRFQIIPEERALSAKFGDEYLDYQTKVRRWI